MILHFFTDQNHDPRCWLTTCDGHILSSYKQVAFGQHPKKERFLLTIAEIAE